MRPQEPKEPLPYATINNISIKELPGLNHLLQSCQSGAISRYEKIEETVSSDALEFICSWISGLQLGGWIAPTDLKSQRPRRSSLVSEGGFKSGLPRGALAKWGPRHWGYARSRNWDIWPRDSLTSRNPRDPHPEFIRKSSQYATIPIILSIFDSWRFVRWESQILQFEVFMSMINKLLLRPPFSA